MMRRWRRRLSRSEWAIGLLKLSRAPSDQAAPGLLLIQIDGLGRQPFDAALKAGRLPFLARLLRREGYALHDLYAGVPSTTPAVQAELFYGVRAAVPAFSFVDPASGDVVRMYEPAAASTLEAQLGAEHEPLLRDGAAYGNIFTGGAAEADAHFCVSALGFGPVLRAANPFTLAFLVLSNIGSVVRIAGLLVVECLLALVDFVRGLGGGFHLAHELKFIPTRVAICIGLRELVTIGAHIDIARGLPIIQLNFAAYDEQSHRRGPNAEFAHWSLKGIDRSIAGLWRAAMKSDQRHYRVWIYSDHGQDRVGSYPLLAGRTIEEAVNDVLAAPRRGATRDAWRGVQSQRALTLRGRRLGRVLPVYTSPDAPHPPGSARVVAMGPIGHVYLPQPVSNDALRSLARRLVTDERVPAVLARVDDGTALAWTRAGEWQLPRDGDALVGASHPFRAEVVADLVALCHHAQSGDLVLAGWCEGADPISFAIENGAHGGFSPRETNGIAVLDADAPLPARPRDYVRAGDLRAAALRTLGRAGAEIAPVRRRTASLRVMTYNVHACRGMDGRTSTHRIARVIGQARPDIVALQELDVGRPRSDHVDQAHQIAQALSMTREFHPAMTLREELYGDAVLCALPMRLIRSGSLPGPAHYEPRGALWVAIEVGGVELQVINTHLGLRAGERAVQIEQLMSEEWLGAALRAGPVVFVGDLNAGEHSHVCQRLARRLTDVQCVAPGGRRLNTWFSRRPTRRIDHIFVSPDIFVDRVDVVGSSLSRVASDHLPLVAEIRLPIPATAKTGSCNAYCEAGPTFTTRESRTERSPP